MSRLRRVLEEVLSDLSSVGARYALVGGLAVSARAEPRTTRDVDLVVSVADDAEAEQVVHELVKRRYEVVSTVEQTAVRRLATVRLRPSGVGRTRVLVDLLFA